MSDKPHVPEARIYVANLSYAMTQDDVVELFETIGTVRDVYLPLERNADRHRGYGFVEMSSAYEAQQAIDELHGEPDFHGRLLTVRIADRDRN